MPYTHIPESTLAGSLAVIIGKVQGTLSANVLPNMLEAADALNQATCPSNSELDIIENRVNRINAQLRSSSDTLERFQTMTSDLQVPLGLLENAIRIITLLPIPQSFPPGFGLPINVTTKFGDLLVLLRQVVKQIGDLVDSITGTLETPMLQVERLREIQSRVDVPLRGCRINNLLQENIDSGLVDAEVVESTGILDVLQKTSRAFLQDAGRTADLNSAGFSLTTTSAALIKEGRISASQMDDAANTEERARCTEALQQSLERLQAINLPQEIITRLEGIGSSLSELDSLESAPEEDPRFNYTGPDGTRYILEIIPDHTAPSIAPRRFAEARDLNGTIRFTGKRSYSSDTDILLDEVKFLIDNTARNQIASSQAVGS